MRIGLFGAGRIGKVHARVIAARLPDDGLIVSDVDPAAARALADEVGARALEEAAVLDEADAVVVAAASDAHAPLVRAAIARGLPVFCEKPLAPDLSEAIAIATEVEAAGVPFQLGYMRRHDAGYQEARRLVGSGELGTLYAIRMASHDPAPPHESYVPASGGLFRDLSGHDFDVLRYLTAGEVEEVYADGSVRGFPLFEKYDDVDTATAMLRMSDGVLVVMTMARHDPVGYDVRTELFGSKDSIAVGMGPHQPIRSVEPGVSPPAGPAWDFFQDRFAGAYREEIERFIAYAGGEGGSTCTARDGVEAARIAEAATRSRLEHRPVPMAEIAGMDGRAGRQPA